MGTPDIRISLSAPKVRSNYQQRLPVHSPDEIMARVEDWPLSRNSIARTRLEGVRTRCKNTLKQVAIK